MVILQVFILVGFHTGADFPETGTGETNPDLYSCVEDGEVVYTHTTSVGHEGDALGNQVQIKDNKTGNFYRYCHMLYGTISVQVGDKVNTSTKLRKNAEIQVIQWVHTFILNFRQL